MIYKIRNGVFETNSSSTHTLSLAKVLTMDCSLIPDPCGTLHIHGASDFGRQEETITDSATKANYVYLDQCRLEECTSPIEEANEVLNEVQKLTRVDILINVIKEQTKAKEVIFEIDPENTRNIDSYWSSSVARMEGFIDHQSWGTTDRLYNKKSLAKTKDILKNFIFNPNSSLNLDSDG